MMMQIFRNKNGNLSLLAALLAVPLIGSAGLAIDVGRAMQVRANLRVAADSAALAALADLSAGVVWAGTRMSDSRVELSEDDARQFFRQNAKVNLDVNISKAEIVVTKTGKDMTAAVTFTAAMPTLLMQILGKQTIEVGADAKAVYQLASKKDFFMLLDNTPSMGVGATQNDIDVLMANTRDQCAFACHIVSEKGVEDTNSYYNLAKKLHVTTRINVVAKAAAALIKEAGDTQHFGGQYRFATYTFGKTAQDKTMQVVQTLTDSLKTASTSTALVDLMSIPAQGYNSDQQTPFDDVLKDVKKEMSKAGAFDENDGRDPVLFFVSDGVADHAKSTACKKKKTGTRCMEPIDVDNCQAIKDAGATIAVLYTTYLPLPSNDFYKQWIKPFQSEIGTKMAECASPGYYFEVSPTGGIEQAMKALFNKTIGAARLVL
jgi:hypothetical protein